MACDVPRPRWFAALARPLSVVLCAAGLLCTLLGVILTSGFAGLFAPAGAVLILLGTSNGAVSALNLGSIFQLANGSRARVEALTKECTAMQSMVQSVAEALCTDASAVRRAVALTMTQVSREWTGRIGPLFLLFLLCRTVAVAREQDHIFGDGSAAAPAHERQAILVLHNLCNVNVADIAVMFDLDVADIRNCLNQPTRQDAR